VLIDDLVNLGATEPYRMFTSRAEYRLLLREDNADQRLTPSGYGVGLVGGIRWQQFEAKMENLSRGNQRLQGVRVSGSDQQAIERLKLGELKNGASLLELLRRPEFSISDLLFLDEILSGMDREVLEQLQVATKYEGYIKRQMEQVERFRRTESVVIPVGFNYDQVSGFSAEVQEKLKKVCPRTLGQAARIPGVTPAAIAILSVLLRRG
jgi:tRNA uridine 5-carboxymethylaminomethyl modification enzyme